jgi:RNA polymerase sigma factor (sigma-70 family)
VQQAEKAFTLEAILPFERARLVHLCAYLSGKVDAAEDLAQETLFEAWQHREKLYDPRGYTQWLSAIAHNVCRRWLRNQGREMVRLVPLEGNGDLANSNLEDSLADETDIELELERNELANLLDSAMALLPPETRTILIERYIQELPQAEVAARLGVSESLLAVRLHRGKLALRKVLSTQLNSEISPYTLYPSVTDGWQQTNIWCPECGQQRLLGRLSTTTREFMLQCRDCYSETGEHMVHHVVYIEDQAGLFTGIKAYKPLLTRLLKWSDNYYRYGLVNHEVLCMKCGRPAPLHIGLPADLPLPTRERHGVHITCVCQPINFHTLSGFALASPEGRRFWREHPRIHRLPEREVEFDGRVALMISIESIPPQVRLDVFFERDTFEVIRIEQTYTKASDTVLMINSSHRVDRDVETSQAGDPVSMVHEKEGIPSIESS